MKTVDSPIIRFAGVEIDVRREYVRVDGPGGRIEQRLRPKTFEVLLYLIDNRDRVVSKSEIFEAVWNGVSVTDDTLVQSIVEIRKALGDDPRSPEFVRTIPRVGYRLIANIEPPATDGEPIVAVPPEPATPRRWTPFVLGGFLVALVAFAVHFSTRPEASPARTSAVAVTPVGVAVATFDSRTATPDLAWLGDGLPSMVTTYLSGDPQLTLIDRAVIERLSRTQPADESRWVDVARRAGARRLISGRFERSGDQIRIDAQVRDVVSGRLLGGSTIVSKRESLLNDVDLLSSRLAVLLGSGAEAGSVRHADRMTDSLDAYEAYSLGVTAADGLENDEARSHFERAIAIDPEFAMAYARIGYTYAVTGASAERAAPYFARAIALGSRLSERERLYVLGWQSIGKRDYARAIDHFRLLISRYPTDTEAYARLGRLLIGEERPSEAVDVLRRGLAIDSDAPELNNVIGIAHSLQGQHDLAISHHQRHVALLPDEPNAHDSLGLSYHWAGEYERALAAYDRASQLNPRFEVAVVHRANTYFQMGRNREAAGELRRYIEMAPTSRDRARGLHELFFLQYTLGRIDPDLMRELVEDSPDRIPYDVLFAIDRGDGIAAVRLAESIRSARHPGRGSREPLRIRSYVRTEAARVSGDEARAVEAARETLRHVPPVYLITDMEDVLGDTLAAFGRHAEAIEEYRRILRLNANRGRTRYKLARSLQAMGQSAAARTEYEHFLRVWTSADADAPEIVEARRWVRSASPS